MTARAWIIDSTNYLGIAAAPDGGGEGAGPLRRRMCHALVARSKHPPAVRHWPLGSDQHDRALRVGKAQREDFRHQGTDLPRREVDDRRHLTADQVFGGIYFVTCADDFFTPMAGPKSMNSLSAGLRASGNGSALTIVPTRMSTARNCSNEIWGAGDDGADIAVARVSKVAGVQTALAAHEVWPSRQIDGLRLAP